MSHTEKKLLNALKGMLNAYAPDAEKTAKAQGEEALHSAVREARAAVKQADTKAHVLNGLRKDEGSAA